MPNPRGELPLDACNSREEIEAWLAAFGGGVKAPNYYCPESRAAALKRMEAIARNDAPLRGALRAFQLLYYPVSKAINPRGWDWYHKVDGKLEETLLYVREQVEAALATAPEATGGEVAVIKLNAEECEELHKILQSPEALRPGVMELIATAPALNADEVPAPLGFSYATSADLMRELGSQNPEKDGAVLDGIASGKVVEFPKRARPTDGGK